VGVINIYDRRVKLDVVERSTAKSVANLTRRALLDWGVPETAVTDNGKDFVAHYLQQVFASLGIYQDILPPFRPDLKPGIERAFRTFSPSPADALALLRGPQRRHAAADPRGARPSPSA
jgi:hypothetical protein